MADEVLLALRNVSKVYRPRGWWPGRRRSLRAVDSVSLSLLPGRTLAIAGASGSGKSTLARCIARFEPPTEGEIWFNGQDMEGLRGERLRSLRRQIQMISQDPGLSL